MVVAGLYGSCHVGSLGAFAVYEEVIGHFDALPSLSRSMA